MKQDAFPHPLCPIVVPDLGIGSEPVKLVMWLVPLNSQIIPGERLVELLAQGVNFQLDAIENGELVEISAQAGAELRCGDVIGHLRLTS